MGSEMSRFAGTVTGVAMLVLLFVFPLYITSQNYGNILRAKYKFFWLLVLIMTGVCLIAGLAWVFMDRMEHHGEEMREFSAGIRQTGLKKLFTTGEKGLLVFIIIALISTLTSEYVYESFWGNEGRYSGFFLLALYTVMYFLVSRFFRFKQWYLDAFLLAAALAGIFGITDYFRMDIMGYKVGVPLATADIFTSTFGNINTFTAFLGNVSGGGGGAVCRGEGLAAAAVVLPPPGGGQRRSDHLPERQRLPGGSRPVHQPAFLPLWHPDGNQKIPGDPGGLLHRRRLGGLDR